MTDAPSSNGRWASTIERAGGGRGALAAIGWPLGALALLEAIFHGAVSHLDVERSVVLALVALGTTLPVAAFDVPGAALVTCATSVLSAAAFDTLTVAGVGAVLVALFRLGLDPRTVWRRLATVTALVVPFFVLALAGPSPASSETAGLTLALSVLAPAVLVVGLAVREGRAAQEGRAARQVVATKLSEQSARGERARIAHELHDVVAHHISMIALQAESARLAVPGLPAAGAQRLSAIGDTARAALTEMRGLLGVLREDGAVVAGSRHPQPGLSQVTALVDEAREASSGGIRLIVSGPPVALDTHVELVAYRIVQEALTNARRHAPGSAVDVEMTYRDRSLRLRVRDNGPGPGPPPVATGHGVAGMQERAAAIGGTVRTGAASGGGYLVEAVLPAKIELHA